MNIRDPEHTIERIGDDGKREVVPYGLGSIAIDGNPPAWWICPRCGKKPRKKSGSIMWFSDGDEVCGECVQSWAAAGYPECPPVGRCPVPPGEDDPHPDARAARARAAEVERRRQRAILCSHCPHCNPPKPKAPKPGPGQLALAIP